MGWMGSTHVAPPRHHIVNGDGGLSAGGQQLIQLVQVNGSGLCEFDSDGAAGGGEIDLPLAVAFGSRCRVAGLTLQVKVGGEGLALAVLVSRCGLLIVTRVCGDDDQRLSRVVRLDDDFSAAPIMHRFNDSSPRRCLRTSRRIATSRCARLVTL